MGTQTFFPNGQVLTSSALTLAQINTIIQPLVANMLGILTSPIEIECATTINSNQVQLTAPAPVYPSLAVSGTGIATGATVTAVNGLTVTISAPATAIGTITATFRSEERRVGKECVP